MFVIQRGWEPAVIAVGFGLGLRESSQMCVCCSNVLGEEGSV